MMSGYDDIFGFAPGQRLFNEIATPVVFFIEPLRGQSVFTISNASEVADVMLCQVFFRWLNLCP